ncbi:hypothetical protein WMB34_004323 [Enterobacter kobei]
MKQEAARARYLKLAICPDKSPGAREILFKLSGAVAADKVAGQRARCETGAKMICCFTVGWVVCGAKIIGDFF